MIEQKDVNDLKTVQDFDGFERIIMENLRKIQQGETTILVPVNISEGEGYEFAEVDVSREELENLSEAWSELSDGNGERT